MNLRIPSDQSLAACWPDVAESLERVRRNSQPAPTIHIQGSAYPDYRAHAPEPEPAPYVRPSRVDRTKPRIADRLAAMAVGDARTVYAVKEPIGFMQKAAAITPGQWRAQKLAPNTWQVERVG